MQFGFVPFSFKNKFIKLKLPSETNTPVVTIIVSIISWKVYENQVMR